MMNPEKMGSIFNNINSVMEKENGIRRIESRIIFKLIVRRDDGKNG